MATFFELVIQQLNEFGFYNFFFPFVLSAVLFYALLRKSKLFGEMREGQILSAVVALSVAFLVLGYPVLVGFSFGNQLSAFFTQIVVVGLVFILGLIIASMFYPDFPKMLSEKISEPSIMYVIIGIAIALFATSGLLGVITQGSGDTDSPRAPRDVVLIFSGLIIFIVIILIATAATSKGEEK